MKYLLLTYEHHLASFLDEKGIQWSCRIQISDIIDDTICVYLPKNYTATDIWKLRSEFEEWKERYCSEY